MVLLRFDVVDDAMIHTMGICTIWIAVSLGGQVAPSEKADTTIEAPPGGIDSLVPRWKEVFQRLDKNGDATLTSEEYVRDSLGKAAENKRQEFEAWDLNQDGTLNHEEFREAPRPKRNADKKFERLDGNGDGRIVWEEYMAKRDASDALKYHRYFVRKDTNSDSHITFKEYIAPTQDRMLTVTQRFRLRDHDRDDELSFVEYEKALEGEPWHGNARESFEEYDLNDDGHLSLDEYTKRAAVIAARRDEGAPATWRIGTPLAIGAILASCALLIVRRRRNRRLCRNRQPSLRRLHSSKTKRNDAAPISREDMRRVESPNSIDDCEVQ